VAGDEVERTGSARAHDEAVEAFGDVAGARRGGRGGRGRGDDAVEDVATTRSRRSRAWRAHGMESNGVGGVA
jgi:hypothetical protein